MLRPSLCLRWQWCYWQYPGEWRLRFWDCQRQLYNRLYHHPFHLRRFCQSKRLRPQLHLQRGRAKLHQRPQRCDPIQHHHLYRPGGLERHQHLRPLHGEPQRQHLDSEHQHPLAHRTERQHPLRPRHQQRRRQLGTLLHRPRVVPHRLRHHESPYGGKLRRLRHRLQHPTHLLDQTTQLRRHPQRTPDRGQPLQQLPGRPAHVLRQQQRRQPLLHGHRPTDERSRHRHHVRPLQPPRCLQRHLHHRGCVRQHPPQQQQLHPCRHPHRRQHQHLGRETCPPGLLHRKRQIHRLPHAAQPPVGRRPVHIHRRRGPHPLRHLERTPLQPHKQQHVAQLRHHRLARRQHRIRCGRFRLWHRHHPLRGHLAAPPHRPHPVHTIRCSHPGTLLRSTRRTPHRAMEHPRRTRQQHHPMPGFRNRQHPASLMAAHRYLRRHPHHLNQLPPQRRPLPPNASLLHQHHAPRGPPPHRHRLHPAPQRLFLPLLRRLHLGPNRSRRHRIPRKRRHLHPRRHRLLHRLAHLAVQAGLPLTLQRHRQLHRPPRLRPQHPLQLHVHRRPQRRLLPRR